MPAATQSLQLPPTNAYVAARKDSTAPAAAPASTDPTATGIADTGAAASSGLTSLGVPSSLAGALPYLAAGGIGLYQANQAAGQTQQQVNQLEQLGKPLTAESNQLLTAANAGQLNPAQQNVVNTLQQQGQTLLDSAAPLASIANTAFANYQAGQLLPGQQQQIDAWTASAKQQLAQTLSDAGVSDSSVLASQNAAIDSQAQQLKANLMAQNLQVGDQQYAQWLTSTQAGQALQAQGAQYAATAIDTMLQQALQFGQVGMQPVEQAIQAAITQDAALSNNIGNLMKSLAGAYGLANAPNAAQQAAQIAAKGAGALGGGGGGGGGGATIQGLGSTSLASGASTNVGAPVNAPIGGTADQLFGGTQVATDVQSQTGVTPQFDTGFNSGSAAQLALPSWSDLSSGNNSVATFGSTGYQVTPDTTISATDFNNSFFDPSTTDLPDISFG